MMFTADLRRPTQTTKRPTPADSRRSHPLGRPGQVGHVTPFGRKGVPCISSEAEEVREDLCGNEARRSAARRESSFSFARRARLRWPAN
jgi:hypothetical protein